MRVLIAAVLTALVGAPSAWSPARAQDPGQDEVLTVNASLVRLNVGVVDRQGHPIMDLSKNDFVVYEDDVLQEVKSFDATTTPFSLVMLLDVSGSTAKFRQNLQLAATRFLDSLGPDDRVCVIAFNEKVDTVQEFTSNRKDLAYAIGRVKGKGDTNLYKALDAALEKLRKTESRRRQAIVVLTDGGDTKMKELDRIAVGNAATVDAAVASIKPGDSEPLRRVLNAADRQGATIYPLALPTGDPKTLPDPNPLQIAIYTAARTRLQILADRTGGRLNAMNRPEEMSHLYGEVAAELRTLYTVTYQSSNTASKRPDNWRAIRISLNRPELLARTRQGYFVK
jgi:VWFA-related protein